MQQMLIGALSVLGIIYLSELNQTNPTVGLPVTAILVILWLGTAFVDYLGRRK